MRAHAKDEIFRCGYMLQLMFPCDVCVWVWVLSVTTMINNTPNCIINNIGRTYFFQSRRKRELLAERAIITYTKKNKTKNTQIQRREIYRQDDQHQNNQNKTDHQRQRRRRRWKRRRRQTDGMEQRRRTYIYRAHSAYLISYITYHYIPHISRIHTTLTARYARHFSNQSCKPNECQDTERDHEKGLNNISIHVMSCDVMWCDEVSVMWCFNDEDPALMYMTCPMCCCCASLVCYPNFPS